MSIVRASSPDTIAEPRSGPQIFVSHSSRDVEHPIFRSLVSGLRRRGAELWIAQEQLSVGDSLIEKLSRGVDSADYILFILSNHTSSSPGVTHEWRLAYADQLVRQQGKILVAQIDDMRVSTDFASLHVYNFARNYERAFNDLIRLISATPGGSLIKFDIDLVVPGAGILEVSGLVGRALIEYFHTHPCELKRINRRKFEELVAEIFSGFGYEVELTAQTRDGGRDVVAIRRKEVEVKYLIECKRPDPGGYVGIRPVRELYGVVTAERATKGILATTAHFSPDALLFFENNRWELEPKDYAGVLEWMADYISLRGKG